MYNLPESVLFFVHVSIGLKIALA